MRFEWDEEKERRNIAKHGIDFTTASYVFNDDRRWETYDQKHSDYEDRFIVIGVVNHVTCVV